MRAEQAVALGALRSLLRAAEAPGNGKPGARTRMAEPTSITASTLDQEVWSVRVAFFPGVNGQRFAREFEAALTSIGACRRLIVDLRGNLGGFMRSLRLMSVITPDRFPVGYSLTRQRLPVVKQSSQRARSERRRNGRGLRLRTAGHRVGTRTGGQVLGGGNFAVGSGFVLRFPAAA